MKLFCNFCWRKKIADVHLGPIYFKVKTQEYTIVYTNVGSNAQTNMFSKSVTRSGPQ